MILKCNVKRTQIFTWTRRQRAIMLIVTECSTRSAIKKRSKQKQKEENMNSSTQCTNEDFYENNVAEQHICSSVTWMRAIQATERKKKKWKNNETNYIYFNKNKKKTQYKQLLPSDENCIKCIHKTHRIGRKHYKIMR